MSTRMPFMRAEGGFTTPAAAVALLVVCALAFVCTRGITVGSRSGQIQYGLTPEHWQQTTWWPSS